VRYEKLFDEATKLVFVDYFDSKRACLRSILAELVLNLQFLSFCLNFYVVILVCCVLCYFHQYEVVRKLLDL